MSASTSESAGYNAAGNIAPDPSGFSVPWYVWAGLIVALIYWLKNRK